MGIALLTLSSLFQGFSSIGRKAASVHPGAGAQRALRMARPSVARPALTPRPVSAICSTRPAALRVVRVCEAQQRPGEMGRLVISGRMADVCAELDRLVAHEAAREAQATRH